MNGILYGVGVGPGDPELITVKALKIIRRTEVLAVPDTSTAYEIAAQAVDLRGKELLQLHLPMTKDPLTLHNSHDLAAETVKSKLQAGYDVAFLTLGDPSIYSSYLYIQQRVAEAGYETCMAEGITSFCAAAARLNMPLCEGEQALHIIPVNYTGTDYLQWQGTKVLMKPGKDFNSIREKLRQSGHIDKTVMIERCGMEGERIYPRLEDAEGDKSYFTLIIVKE